MVLHNSVGSSDHDQHALHVFDLPQMYQRPSLQDMMKALELLHVAPVTLDAFSPKAHSSVIPEGVTNYLTNIIKSSLSWIECDSDKELIRDLAGRRLSERSGRVAMPTITRKFLIPNSKGQLEMSLREPSITGDDLGLKTWAASYVFAKHLHRLGDLRFPSDLPASKFNPPSVLELGSGTGLLGLAAAAVWKCHVLLTDLQPIVKNLQANIEANTGTIQVHGGTVSSAILDWNEPSEIGHLRTTVYEEWTISSKFQTILAADSIYSSSHPAIFAQTVQYWLADAPGARLGIAYPIREGYEKEIENLRNQLLAIGLCMIEEGNESAQDDWQHEVLHSWSVWAWNSYSKV